MRPSILAIPIVALLGTPAVAQPAQSPTTFCNPLNLNYCFRGGYREAADPVVIIYKNDYYLFASKSNGYWWSSDLASWNFVNMPAESLPIVDNYAPAVWVYHDTLFMGANDWAAIHCTTDPKSGKKWTWVSNNYLAWDPCVFADDNGKYYCVAGAGGLSELDPTNGWAKKGSESWIGVNRASDHGWEQHVSSGGGDGYVEGAWMVKRNGIYYFNYAAPGTEFREYADGAATSTSIQGPYTYAQNSPVAFKSTGFITGGGHGCVFEDKQGNWWRVGSITIAVNAGFERRLAMFPTIFTADGTMHHDQILGDYPQYLPGKKPAIASSNGVGWMELAYGGVATASSSADAGHAASRAVDANIQTSWSAATSNAGEWFSVDMRRSCTINAIQTNFAEFSIGDRSRSNLYHQYTIEGSTTGSTWFTIIDKSANAADVPHDYVELAAAVTARYIRCTFRHMSADGKCALTDLRVFGTASGTAPSPVSDFAVVRNISDRRQSTTWWHPAQGAEGYLLRFGIAPDKLFNAYEFRNGTAYRYQDSWVDFAINDTSTTFSSLNRGPDYYYRVDAFNGSGITIGTTVKCDDDMPLRAPDNPATTIAGLTYDCYEGAYATLPVFSTLTPVRSGTVTDFDISVRSRSSDYALVFAGFLDIPTDGVWTLSTNSDDGSKLYIGSTLIVNNDGNHGPQVVTGKIGLQAGKHAIRVEYAQGGGGQSLVVSWQANGASTSEKVPANRLFRVPGGTGAVARNLEISASPTLLLRGRECHVQCPGPHSMTLTRVDGRVVLHRNAEVPSTYRISDESTGRGVYYLRAVGRGTELLQRIVVR